MIPESLIPQHGPWKGMRAAWLDAYCNTMSRMRPHLKPTTVTAMAHAARATQGWAAPTTLDAEALRVMLDKARESDVPEVEPLRAVVFNDVALEIGRPDHLIPLTISQRLIAALA